MRARTRALAGTESTRAGADGLPHACAASVPVTLVSSVVNDTPLVAMMIPIVLKWANKNAMPPSWFLLPLSYSALLGGVITIIGSSTNLVLADLMLKDRTQGHDPDFQLSFFSTTLVALPVALIAGTLPSSPPPLLPSTLNVHTPPLPQCIITCVCVYVCVCVCTPLRAHTRTHTGCK